MAKEFELVVVGGRLIDPTTGVDESWDVGIADGSVFGAGEHLRAESSTVVHAGGHMVVPGLVDIHSHFFYGLGAEPVDPRTDLLPTGVTCAADAGTAGSAHFTALRDLLIRPAPLTLCAWLNIEVLGLSSAGFPRVPALSLALVDRAIETIEENRDTIVGVKVLSPSAGPEASQGVELVRRAVAAAEATGLPVLCHIDGGTDLVELLAALRPGDIVSHAFHGNEPNLIGPDGHVLRQVWTARERGILFDVCPCGGYHMAWGTAEAAIRDGFFPDLIGTDFVRLPWPDPSYDITDCMTMMLGLGMPMLEVLRAVTTTAARAIGRADRHGSLKPGRQADIAILGLDEHPVTYQSKADGRRSFDRRIRNLATVRGGQLVWLSNELTDQPVDDKPTGPHVSPGGPDHDR